MGLRLSARKLDLRCRLVAAAVLSLISPVALAQEPQSAPSAVRSRGELNRPEIEPQAPTVRYRLPAPSSAYSIPPTAALAAQTQPSDPRKPTAGASLAVAPEARQSGVCQAMPDGSNVWRWAIRSPGAKALRVHFTDFDARSGSVWLSVPSLSAPQSLGPYTGGGIFRDGEFWSGTVLSDTVTVEYEPGPGETCPQSAPFQISEVAHIWAGLDASPIGPNNPADACNLDVSCYSSWANQAHSVARYTWLPGDGFIYFCSGTLVNTKPYTGQGLFLTANHCISTDTTARSINVFWFYETPFCNGPAPDMNSLPFQTVGASYLISAPEPSGDYSLVRLTSLPNSPNVYFAGWTTGEPAMGGSITGIHHPGTSNDYKRIAFGTRGPDQTVDITNEGTAPAADYFIANWTSGTTEGGSSGSPLFLYVPSLNENVITGIDSYGPKTHSGASACSAPNFAGYGRFSVAYPALKTYLDFSACTFGFTPGSFTTSAFAISSSVSVSTAGTCAWTAASDSSWVTLSSPTSHTGSGTQFFNVLTNPSSFSRTANITIGGQIFTVTQLGQPPVCSPTSLSLNQTIQGTLASGSCVSVVDPTTYATLYTFFATAGQRVAISMFSPDFDTYLNLLDSHSNLVAQDDDGGGGTNSRIPSLSGLFTIPVTGTYTIEATSYSSFITGSFTLQLAAGVSNDEITGATNVGSLPAGYTEDTTGATSNVPTDPVHTCTNQQDTHTVWFRWLATLNGPVRVNTLGSSYDTVLAVFQNSTSTQIACSDDTAGTVQSDLTFTATAGQNYYFQISSFGSSTGGTLILNVTAAVAVSKTAIFRNGLWVIDLNGNGQWDGPVIDRTISLGQAGDIAVVGDWNGDGRQKAGIFRNGLWVLDYNGNGQWDGPGIDRAFVLGQAGDVPVVGDWNGSGTTKVGIFRNGLWVLDYNGNGQWDGLVVDRTISLGQAGDTPVVGDWNGSGTAKVGIFRNGLWVLDYNGNGQWDGPVVDRVMSLGQAGDIPVLGDWNHSGTTKGGVFRNGFWVLDYNGNFQWDGPSVDKTAVLGQGGDVPVVGDWNGSGTGKIGIFRNGLWVLDYNGNFQWDGPPNDRAITLGQSGDVARPARW